MLASHRRWDQVRRIISLKMMASLFFIYHSSLKLMKNVLNEFSIQRINSKQDTLELSNLKFPCQMLKFLKIKFFKIKWQIF